MTASLDRPDGLTEEEAVRLAGLDAELAALRAEMRDSAAWTTEKLGIVYRRHDELRKARNKLAGIGKRRLTQRTPKPPGEPTG